MDFREALVIGLLLAAPRRGGVRVAWPDIVVVLAYAFRSSGRPFASCGWHGPHSEGAAAPLSPF